MDRAWRIRTGLACMAVLGLSGCRDGFDLDLRDFGNGFDTSGAAIAARAETRPPPDARGVISYPGYQVVVARPGDTVGEVAGRVGLPADELARYNGIPPDAALRRDEIVALPRRVSEPSPATGAVVAGPIRPAGEIDVATIASGAIDRAEAGRTSAAPVPTGTEPIRHRVAAGETAFSIARQYGVSITDLAQWNGLGEAMTVRVGQFLLIPPVDAAARLPRVATAPPGQGSRAPEPPSAAAPLPARDETSVAAATPPAPDLAAGQSAASDTGRLLTPVAGRIIRGYEKRKNDGIDIAAAPGTAVRSADAGTVAAITRDTDQVPIVVVRHAGNLLTVYAGVEGVKVAKGDSVSRGQTIAAIRDADPAFLHFEVREGFESVDPSDYLD